MKRYSIETLIRDDGNVFYIVDSLNVDNDEYYVHMTKDEVIAVRLEILFNDLDIGISNAILRVIEFL